ncbi:hypothetical protein DFH09DRAFT_1185637 [Mycena vulgaris]|nr:hypothetical protein DFH09DRAFT_1185637 [Mycena vulgaris]
MALRLPLVRLAVLSTVLLFAVITLGLAAALTSTTSTDLGVSFSYGNLAIATSVITMITLPAMIFLEFKHPGGVASMIISEIGWLTILWVLWLSTGVEAAQASSVYIFFLGGCGASSADFGDGVETLDSICRETSAIEAFGFLNWIILMVYTFTLLIMSLAAASRKHTGVWQSSVADAPFFAAGPASSAPASSAPGAYNAHAPATAGGTAGTVNSGTVHV